MTQRTFPDIPLTPPTFLERSARVFPDKIALQHGERAHTYRDFGARERRLASALRAHGVRPGDRVAFHCPNIPPMLEAHFGVLLAGAILVPINIWLSVGEIAYILEHSGSQMLFLDSEWAGIGEALRSEVAGIRHLVSIVDDPAFPPLDGLTYEDFLTTGSEEAFPHEVTDEHSEIAINYT